MYINSSTGDVYGPKTSGGWGAVACNIRGPAGAPGATGATGYSPQYIVAAGVPGAGVGNNGDMYINSTTSDVYGPKASGAWGGIVCNIKGAAGAAGPPGVGYNPRGAWAAGTTYAQGDQVSSGGSLYISLVNANTGNSPATSPTFWEPVAATPAGSQTPWLQNIDAATFELHNTAKIGIATSAPAYPLDVVGDVNITGVYRVGGVPIGTASQTPWTADINAASHRLYSAGTIAVANDGSVEPASGVIPEILLGSTVSAGPNPRFVMIANTTTPGSSVGSLAYANYAIAAVEKRIATIACFVGAAQNTGYTSFYDAAAGVLTEILRLESNQATIFGASSANLVFNAATINAPNTAMALQTAGVARVTILAAGNVGIGVSTPNVPLQANGTAQSAPSLSSFTDSVIFAYNNGLALGIGGSSSGSNPVWLQVKNGGGNGGTAYPLVLNPLGGPVGIGTTAPLAPLDVAGVIRSIGGGAPGTGSGVEMNFSAGIAYFTGITRPGTYLPLHFNGSVVALQPDTPNYVAIGKATASYMLDVLGDVNCTGAFRVNGTPIAGGTSSVAVATSSGYSLSGSYAQIPGLTYTASKAGTYLVLCTLNLYGATSGTLFLNALYVNGVQQTNLLQFQLATGGGQNATITGHWLVSVPANTTFAMQGYATSPANIASGASMSMTWIST
jgi:hypothetical protein